MEKPTDARRVHGCASSEAGSSSLSVRAKTWRLAKAADDRGIAEPLSARTIQWKRSATVSVAAVGVSARSPRSNGGLVVRSVCSAGRRTVRARHQPSPKSFVPRNLGLNEAIPLGLMSVRPNDAEVEISTGLEATNGSWAYGIGPAIHARIAAIWRSRSACSPAILKGKSGRLRLIVSAASSHTRIGRRGSFWPATRA